MFSNFDDAIVRESYIVDEISVSYRSRLTRDKARTLQRLSLYTKTQFDSSLLSNEQYTAKSFRDQFQPDVRNVFKGRLGHKRRLGVPASIPLDDTRIEQALADPDESFGFYSAKDQWHLSIEVKLFRCKSWKGHYLPSRQLRNAVGSVIQSFPGFPPTEGFRLPDGVMIVWLFDCPYDSESMVQAVWPRLQRLELQHPNVRLNVVGTTKRSAFIPARQNMVDGRRLLPLQFPNQPPPCDPVALLGPMLTRQSPVAKTRPPQITPIKVDRKKYRGLRNSLSTHFSSRRRKAVVRLFNHIWAEHDKVKTGQSTVRPWISKAYGPDCVALPASNLKLVNDAYKEVLRKLEELRVLMPVGRHSHGEDCYDPHPTFFLLDRDAVVPVHPGRWIIAQLSTTYSSKEIALAAGGVTPRTVTNWKKRPDRMPPDVAVKLQQHFGIKPP